MTTIEPIGSTLLPKNLVIPGDRVSASRGFMRGHGTYVVDGELRASVAGVVEQVNKLVCVRPVNSRYGGEIGDVVIGQITGVQQKRWKVDANARLNSILQLSSVNLPGGELRRKSVEDERAMREYLREGDLISAEVQQIFHDGVLSLHTRNLRYGKLSQGILVKVYPSLVKRRKSHFHNLPCGASIILGCNGYIWISRTIDDEAGLTGGYVQDLNQIVPLDQRKVIVRINNCVALLAANLVLLYDTTIMHAYEISLPYPAKDLLIADIGAEIAQQLMAHSPTVVICEDTTDLHSKLSDYLKSIITAAIDDIEKSDEFRHVIIGVSGGAMPKLIVPVLLAINNIDWASKVRFFSVDERMVPLNDSESNTGAYLTQLNGRIYHFPPYGPIDCVQTCAANYEAHIRSWHPKIDDGWPMFDLLLLGLGTDGHTCSLFPDHRLLNTNDTNWMVPIDDSPKPPPHRITITLPVINRAANVAFIAFGAEKAEIVKAIVKDGSKKYPASRVNVANLHWFLDRESAEHL